MRQLTAKSTANNLFLLSVNFVAQSHSGFAGATPIFATNATKNRLMESTFREFRRKNCLSAREREVAQWEASMAEMERSFVWAVECAEDRGWTLKIFETNDGVIF